MSDLAKDFPKVIIDQTAESWAELVKQWPMSKSSLMTFIQKKLDSGEWEKVRKIVNGNNIPAYRRVKKK